jgi:hypothetical protein
MDDVDARPKRKRPDLSGLEAQPHKNPRLASDLHITSAEDSNVVQHIGSRCDVQVLSVISSSKMQNRVTSVLRHLLPQHSPEISSQFPTRPRVSVLRAKAQDAGKLVSIAEIVKREIGKGTAGDAAKSWYQYIALGEETKETPREKGKTVIENTILDGRSREEDEDEFEVMKTPFERAIEGRPKVRAIPVMSLFLSTVAIDELGKRYDEQTNEKLQRQPS